ncbi:DnaJ family domain-containing protein [Herbidospora sp. RD11066]
MTDRKPVGMNFETWIDRQIREAAERGEFDDLPGAGKPLPRGHDDEMGWIKRKLDEEGLEFPLPGGLGLRREAEKVRAAAVAASSEERALALVEEMNERIKDAVRHPMDGPPVIVPMLDVDDVIAAWREAHPAPVPPPAATAPPPRRRWWRLGF